MKGNVKLNEINQVLSLCTFGVSLNCCFCFCLVFSLLNIYIFSVDFSVLRSFSLILHATCILNTMKMKIIVLAN